MFEKWTAADNCFGNTSKLGIYHSCNRQSALIEVWLDGRRALSALNSLFVKGLRMGQFSKNCGCPSSAELLEYLAEGCTAESGGAILHHLAVCEFCEAEVSFYRRFPPMEASFEPVPMPEPLFELAEALLVKNRGIGPLKNLLGEIDIVNERR